jgi:prepilin-type N-terminal cleavage/methylation domain-containing protein
MRFSASSRGRNYRPHRQPAFTLMEVIIALAVLGMSMVAIGTLIQIGGQNALQARS